MSHMNTERVKPTEQLPAQNKPHPTTEGVLNEYAIENVLNARKASLELLKPLISRKLFYILEEKIKHEAAEFQNLLDAQLGRKKTLSKYTFVLDPQYFEQIFLS